MVKSSEVWLLVFAVWHSLPVNKVAKMVEGVGK